MSDSGTTPEAEPAPDLQPGAPPPKTAPKRRRRMRWGWFWIVVVATAIAAVWTFGPGLNDGFRSGGLALQGLESVEARLAVLESDLAGIRTEQAELRAAVSAAEIGLGTVVEQAAGAAAEAGAARTAAARAATPADLDALAAALDARVAAVARALNELGARVEVAAADDALEGRVADLEAAAAAAAGASGAAAPPPPADAGLARRIADLERAIADLRTAPAAEVAAAAAVAAVESRLTRGLRLAEERIADVERAVTALGAAGAGARSALVVAAAQLQAQLRTSQGFADQLAAVRAVAEGEHVNDPALDAALAEMDAFAAGVQTVEELARGFSPLAGDLVAAGAGDAGDGWAADLWARLRGAVTVRRTGEVEGDDTEARVARAEMRLGEGDLAGAIAEVSRLEGAAAEAVAPWLADARARLAVDVAAERLGARALAAVTGSGEGAP